MLRFKDVVMLNGFGTVCNALGKRVKPYLPQICGTILWRLNNKAAKVRQQAADLIAKIAPMMKICQEVRKFYPALLRFAHNQVKNDESIVHPKLMVSKIRPYLISLSRKEGRLYHSFRNLTKMLKIF